MTMRHTRGFTMIELMAVLAVLAILAWVSMPLAEIARERQREHDLRQALWQIRDAIDAYKRVSDTSATPRDPSDSGYPPTLQALVQGVPDSHASGRIVHFLRRIPRDPFAAPELPAEQTWGLRSFDTPAESPKPGADVYDVYSRAPGNGLDGVEFKLW